MRQTVTLKQIANEIGVSISTVSKALRNSVEIGAETKLKIQAYAKLYNYRPNNIALSLKNRKTKTIGVIIPEIVHHFFSKVIKGIEQVANKRGYNVIIGLSNESFDKEVINMQLLANGSIDGFILSISKETLLKQDYHHFTESIDQGMPIVMFDRVVNDIKCDKVVVDDYEGSRKAVELLISKGCKNIALITTKDYVSVGRLRTKGYLEALDLNKIVANSEFILKVDDNDVSDDHLESLESDIEKLLKQNKVDGIFAVNEIYAITAMKVARKLKLNIPENIKIIGFTDGVLSKHASPSLTTVSQHAKKMGEISAKLIIDKLESKETHENNELIIIPTEIIERESTL
ncbi:MAG: LacI family DNA-binding transcriptional regulator [Flavobacteriales bacterium]|jgi:LacI family transcriptional regulator|tara:strand:- start:15909 stop:16946 length:1038 start_codon:yes stop_codon:yes gene_type:complete